MSTSKRIWYKVIKDRSIKIQHYAAFFEAFVLSFMSK